MEMNKRIRKKRNLAYRVQFAESLVDFLLDQNNQLWKRVETMEKTNSENVEASNQRFDELESKDKSLRADLDKVVTEIKKNQKKSWFSRK